jgi:hypothetical protein
LRRHFLPVEVQPGEVAPKRIGQLGARAGTVNILDPQQEPSAALPCQIVRDDRGIGVAQVQRSIGTRGETGDGACGNAGRLAD